ncbi:MAG: efflux RND transporter periplasmic adaptor subunit [Cyclobacteriaceae bacterium]
MKATKFLFVTLILIMVFSCSVPESKESELEKLKKQHAELTEKIRTLERDIKSSRPESAVKTKMVVADVIKVGSFEYFVETQGGVEAEENILVSAKSPGVVVGIFVKEGQAVKAGQVLAQIDNSITLKAIEELQGSLDLARTVFERQKSLWDQKIGTEIQFLTAKNNMESLERRLATLKEQDELSRVRSGISGTVDDIMLKVGETTSPGMPAARIVNTGKLKISSNVSEAYINSLAPGNEAIVQLGDISKTFTGKVSFTGKNINPLSRTFGIEIPVPGGTDARPGMSARIKVIYRKLSDAIVLPVNLVQNGNDEQFVFVAEEKDGKWIAVRRVVKTGGTFSGKSVILSGLQSGDRVISVGYQGLNDGEPVSL